MAGKDASGATSRFWSTSFKPGSLLISSVVVLAAIASGPWMRAAVGQVRPASATAPATAVQQTLPVLAVVNGEQITRQALANECLRRYGDEVLDSMLNKHIILQACQTRQITITQQDVEDEIQHIAAKFNLSIENYLSLLESERDVNPMQYRTDIVWPTLALRQLASKEVAVTEEEYKKAFESEYGPRVKARLIAVTSQQKADWLVATLRSAPDSFAQLAKEHSEDGPTASAYGVIPPIRMHVGDPDIERIAFSLKEGEISPVIQVGNQYILLQCEKQIPRTYISSQQLPQIEQQL